MPVYFIRSEQVDHGMVRVGEKLEHHLRNVLRLEVDEALTLVDETPTRYHAKVSSAHPYPLVLKIEKKEDALTRPPQIHLGLGILKKGKMEWLIQKACELGASRISPLITERTVVRAQPEGQRRQKMRWQKIATEAAQQSCQWRIPHIDAPENLKGFLYDESHKGFKFILLERLSITHLNHKTLRAEISTSPHHGALLIGPEGGWSPSEMREAKATGFLPLSLGDQILRSETAALAALAIIQYEIANGNSQTSSL